MISLSHFPRSDGGGLAVIGCIALGKMPQIFFTPSVPELICNMLNASPASFTVNVLPFKLSWMWQNKLGFASKKGARS